MAYITIFLVGIISLSVMSILGLIFITKITFSQTTTDTKILTSPEISLARLTTILLWFQIVWILLGSSIITVWFNGLFNDT